MPWRHDGNDKDEDDKWDEGDAEDDDDEGGRHDKG